MSSEISARFKLFRSNRVVTNSKENRHTTKFKFAKSFRLLGEINWFPFLSETE